MGSGMGGGLLRTGFVVLLVLLGLAGVLWIGSATIKPPPARPAEAYADISWLAPQNRTFPLDAADPEVVVLISGVRGWPTNGAEVTFSIVSGPASLRGTEAVVSDVRGTARTEHLELTGAGTVVIEVGIDLLTSRFEFEVTAPRASGRPVMVGSYAVLRRGMRSASVIDAVEPAGPSDAPLRRDTSYRRATPPRLGASPQGDPP